VIGKIGPRGERASGLIYYLFGPGRSAEHTDAHIVAGWRHPAELEPPVRDDGRRDFRRLNGLLQQPQVALGEHGMARPVWHCSVRAAPGDRMLSDDEWAQVACDVMDRTGLSPYGQDDEGARWVAVRHAADHIHIVAMLARQDGRRPRLWNDFYRVGEACQAAELRFGLQRTAARDRTAARRPTRAESEKARRRSCDEAPRATLRRAVSAAAACASSEVEFFARLEHVGVLVRRRFSSRDAGVVSGFAVALPRDVNGAGGPVWFGGGKLAADLTLPRLRRRWEPARSTVDSAPFTPEERSAILEHATRAAGEAARQIRHLAAVNPGAAADTAWAAADVLHAAAAALNSRTLRQAADGYDRAARVPYGRIPARSPTGHSLRRAARLLGSVAAVANDPAVRQVRLIARLADLTETVAELRDAQQRAAQASAARRAAEQLRAAAGADFPPSASMRVGSRATADRTSLEFPFRPGAAGAEPAGSGGAYRSGYIIPRLSRTPARPRPRGPTR
jgi:hypothetical protein